MAKPLSACSNKRFKCRRPVRSGLVRSGPVRSVPIEFPRMWISVNPRNCTYAFPHMCTVGFTIFPYIVALVHTAPYVVLYHHYRRRTLAKVPRHFSFFTFFWQTGASRFSRTFTMGVVGHGLSTAAHGQKTPVPGQHACFPHHGRLPTRSVRSNSSRGGRST